MLDQLCWSSSTVANEPWKAVFIDHWNAGLGFGLTKVGSARGVAVRSGR